MVTVAWLLGYEWVAPGLIPGVTLPMYGPVGRARTAAADTVLAQIL
jgi:hypothetical protein